VVRGNNAGLVYGSREFRLDEPVQGVGRGIGNYAFHLAQKGYEILCVDHSETAISLAKEKNSHPSL
jgi:2-polyprenyl-3-methyl-5-hydroxy-6-metoxy-1,4-benzoquinol methylase